MIAAKRSALTPDLKMLAPDAALDQGLVEELVRLINGAYTVGEAGLWQQGATRTQPHEIAAAIRNRGLLAARLEGRLVGCAYMRQLDAGTADLGLISTATDYWGSGIGRALVRSAEEHMRSRGVSTMQLELLVPKGCAHPEKDKLRAWYTRLGYRVVRSAPFEQIAAHLATQLATACEMLIFHKSLTELPGRSTRSAPA